MRSRSDIALSTHFLDNIIDVNKYPLPEIDALSKRIRRIGLGVMGFADALVRLGIAVRHAGGRRVRPQGDGVRRRRVARRRASASRTSAARSPSGRARIWGPDETCARDENGKRIRPMQLLRNCNVTTVAPTGTISIIAGCSSGLEPLFAVAFMRNQAGVMMPDVNEDFVAIAKREGWYSDALMERIAHEGRVDFPEVPEKWQRVFVTANAIAPEWHMRMQAAFQEHCDSAISQDDELRAHGDGRGRARDLRARVRLKCKGVTVYRDGSRDNQVLSHRRDGEGEGRARRRRAARDEARELG